MRHCQPYAHPAILEPISFGPNTDHAGAPPFAGTERRTVRHCHLAGGTSTDNAQAVIDAIASIAEPLRPHPAEEETVLLPIASKWMSPEEFGRLPGHHMMSFRADKPWLLLGLVREQLDQEHRDGMLAGMPPEMRTIWTEQMEPAFNAFIAEVRR